jgi:hypothetical protein
VPAMAYCRSHPLQLRCHPLDARAMVFLVTEATTMLFLSSPLAKSRPLVKGAALANLVGCRGTAPNLLPIAYRLELRCPPSTASTLPVI